MDRASQFVIDEATSWVDESLGESGRTRTGAIEIRRDRPWAIVASLPTNQGRVWLKVNHEAFQYEGAALQLLDRAVPNAVLRPVAVHPDRGWFLSDDGGPTVDEDPGAVSAEQIADTYVRIQRASVNMAAELDSVGVPTHRPADLVHRFDAAVGHDLAGKAADRCAPLRRTVIDLCAVFNGQVAMTNTDLKPSHVFVGPPPTLFDWGDAVLAHPLFSCGTVRRSFGDRALAQFTEAWGYEVYSPTVAAASSLVDLMNLDVWLRDPTAALDRHPGQIEKLLNQLADHLETV